MHDWIATADQLPPNGEIVETKIDDAKGERNAADLKRSNNLWFLADGSMYVYYRPTHWRPIAAEKQAKYEQLELLRREIARAL